LNLGSGYTQDSLILFLDISVRILGEPSHVTKSCDLCYIRLYLLSSPADRRKARRGRAKTNDWFWRPKDV